jgi:outer membrane protein assembly factor BamD
LFYGSLFCVLACGATQQTAQPTAERYYQEGLKELQKRHCLKAIELFQRIVTSWPGSDFVDDAQYSLAESHRCAKEYTEAIFEYERLIREYRNSPYVDDATLKIGVCYFEQSLPVPLDQKDTYNAIDYFTRFLEDYPGSPLADEAQRYLLMARTKLAEKQYQIAKAYRSWENDEAALIYYREILNGYGETSWAPPAAYEAGEVLLKQGHISEALEMFRRASKTTTDPELKKRAIKRIEELERRAYR